MCCRYTTTPRHSYSVPLWGQTSTTGRIRTRETAVLETARAPSRSGRVCLWRRIAREGVEPSSPP